MVKRHEREDEDGGSSNPRKSHKGEEEEEGPPIEDHDDEAGPEEGEGVYDESGSEGEPDGDGDDEEDIDVVMEAGVLIKMEVVNFTCHKALTIHFNKNINFIVGHSGSGKSTIIKVLHCLGARTSSANCTSELTDNIRHGEGDAQVSVTVSNCKEYGYKFDVFGDSITIRRTLKKTGDHPFQLIGSDGVVHAADEREIDALLEAMEIQVDNPCVVIDKMNSKIFMIGGDKERYEIYMNATNMKRASIEIEAQKAEYYRHVEDAEKTAALFPRLIADIKRLKAKLEEFRVLQELERKVRVLKARFDGFDLDGQPIVLGPHETKETCQQQLESAQKSLADAQEKMKMETATQTEVVEQFQTARDSYKEAKESIAKCENLLEELRPEIREKLRRFRRKHNHLWRNMSLFLDDHLISKGVYGRVEFDHESKELRMNMGGRILRTSWKAHMSE